LPDKNKSLLEILNNFIRTLIIKFNFPEKLTCNRRNKFASVFVCLAVFQDCFCAEYRFIGHILSKQSRNFTGGAVRSPALGFTTVRSSTKLFWIEEKKDRLNFGGNFENASKI
jgi:hypothetical protein